MGTSDDIPGDHVGAVLDGIEEALAAAEAADDDRELARLLASAAHAAMLRGDARSARGFGERAARATLRDHAARFDALRAQGFAARAAGELESALNHAIKARGLARELGRRADVAEQSCILASTYLWLGAHHEARSCADAALEAAQAVGGDDVTAMATGWRASADGESGDLDSALARLATIDLDELDPITRVELSYCRAYWLVERSAADDVGLAANIITAALAASVEAGVEHRCTALHATAARAATRLSNGPSARDHLEQARRVSNRAEPHALTIVALAGAEVLPVTDPQRKVMLGGARARILRAAQRREDPRAYCVDVRIHRRVLELSGGVPADLPGGQ